MFKFSPFLTLNLLTIFCSTVYKFLNFAERRDLRTIIIILLFQTNSLFGYDFLTPKEDFNKPRFIGTTAFCGIGWVGSTLGLQFVWYKDFEKTPFHFFDDSHEWMQMDKMGHGYGSYAFSRASGDLYYWSGLPQKQAAIIGAGFGFLYVSTFEILDAYNEAWGFSWSDISANATGALLYGIQEYTWGEQRIKPKFSFSNSGLAQYRPEVLGNSFSTRILKDYNGQTYWLSFNPFVIANKESVFPKWINLSLGYGINNHLVGDGSTYVVIENGIQSNFTPYRQYYLSLDVDFERIPTNSAWLKITFRLLNHIKVPFPAVEFSKNGINFRPLYF